MSKCPTLFIYLHTVYTTPFFILEKNTYYYYIFENNKHAVFVMKQANTAEAQQNNATQQIKMYLFF